MSTSSVSLSLSDVVSAFYHSWSFMASTQLHCSPLFQELLLLLQPLSVLPFDLNLLLEPRLRQMCFTSSPAPPCSTLLITSWPKLQAEVPRGLAGRRQPTGAALRPPGSSPQEPWRSILQGGGGRHPEPAGPAPDWLLRPAHVVDGVVEEEGCGSAEEHNCLWSPRDPEAGAHLEGEEATAADPRVQADGAPQGGLRWAKLFGAVVGSPRRAPGAPGGLRGSQRRRSLALCIDKIDY